MEISNKIVADITTHMKYAKYLPEEKRREDWNELVRRNMQMHIENYPDLEIEIMNNFQYVFDRKVLPSMRSFQFAGKPIALSPARIYNCSYMAVDSVYAFREIMFLGLSGCGVGISVQKHHVSELPPIKKPNSVKRFLIGDSIEGWADAVSALFKAYTRTNGALPIFDYNDIRVKGSLLKTSGGKAPGPDGLKKTLDNIKALLDNKHENSKLTPIEVYDIICHISEAVLSGGIRRSATITIFSEDDNDMLTSKSNFEILDWVSIERPAGKSVHEIEVTILEPNYGETKHILYLDEFQFNEMKRTKRLPWYLFQPQRGRSNNSVTLLRSELTENKFNNLWNIIKESGSGEPGIFLTNDLNVGTNPCFSGDTLILTNDGYKPIKDLVGVENLKLVNKDGKVVGGKVWSNGVKQTIEFEIETNNIDNQNSDNSYLREYDILNSLNSYIRCTPEHEFLSYHGSPIKAVDIKTRERIKMSSEFSECFISNLYRTEKTKYEEVFDFSLDDDTHWGCVEGLVAHNCCEISLNSMQFCNLTTVNVCDVTTQDELNARVKAATFIGTLQAGYTDFHYLRSAWKENTEREALLGVSMTGIASGEVLKLDLKEASVSAINENSRVAKLLGINKAARVTTIKPEGTGTLALGAIGSGVHAAHAPYYIRRIRVNKSEGIYDYLKRVCPAIIEDEYFNPESMAVISLPQKCPDGYLLRNESPIELLERVKRFHDDWVKHGHRSGVNTHNVSVTCSIKEGEWDLVGSWLWNNRDSYAGVSVLPYDGGTYIQAPFEDCDKETYERLHSMLRDIDLREVIEYADNTAQKEQVACSGGSCEVI